MGNTAVTFRPSSQIAADVQRTRGQVPDMPIEAAQGYPVPVVHDGALRLVIPFYRRSGRPPEPPQVYPLQWFVVVDARSGSRLELKSLKEGVSEPLGKFVLDPKPSMKEFEQKQQQLYSLLDTLLPYAGSPPTTLSDDLKARTAEFRRLWQEVSPPVLNASYRRINPRWFDFIGLK